MKTTKKQRCGSMHSNPDDRGEMIRCQLELGHRGDHAVVVRTPRIWSRYSWSSDGLYEFAREQKELA